MKRIIDFNVPMIGSNRKPIMIPDEASEGGMRPYTLAENLSSILFNMTKGDIRKYVDWSDWLYKKQVLELDGADTDKLRKDVIENFQANEQTGQGGMAIGIKQQYFNIIDAAVELAKNPPKTAPGGDAPGGE